MADASKRIDIGLFAQDRQLKDTISKAKASFDELRAKAKNIALTADDRDLQLKAKAAALQLDKLNKTIARPNIKLEGIDTAILKAELLDSALSKTSKDTLPIAENAVTGLGKDLGSLGNYAMPIAIGGLVALGGQAITVGLGLGGVAAAAIPVIRNAQLMKATLAPLSKDFNMFSKSLQPEVLGIFNKGVGTAEGLLSDLKPAATASGKALDGVMTSIDNEFKSGTWQQFFGYVEKNAGPDIQQLGGLFTDLLDTLPAVAEDLHPLGAGLITVADDALKATHAVASFWQAAQNKNPLSTKHTINAAKDIDSWVTSLTNHLPGGKWINDNISSTQRALGDSSAGAAKGQGQMATAAQQAALAVAKEAQAMNSLSAAIGNATTKLLTLQGDDISWHQAMNDATAALKQNHDALTGNSNAALADKQALLTATNAAIKHAQSQVQLGHDVTGADKTLNSQIAYLAEHAGKSKFAQQEIQALITAENHIPGHITSAIKVNSAAAATAIANIENRLAQLNGQTSTVYVDYSVGGQSYVVPHHRKAAGGLIPGSGNGDTYPALLTPGEAVVPKRLVPAVAPFLKAQGVPGFSMGAVPDFSPLAGSTTTIRLEWAGGGQSDREFMSWLSKNIRVSGGDPGVLVTKR